MPLAHAIVTAPLESRPQPQGTQRGTHTLAFLHGILGSGANWRTFAKQIAAAQPSWTALLVDLRLHGESQGPFSRPHTLEAAARDVTELIAALEPTGIPPVRGILAHSFGGKVGLELARQRGGDLDHLFIIDATPSARLDARGSESTRHIVDLLTQLPTEFPDRPAFTAWMEERGVSRPVAMWLGMNVRPIPTTTRFVFRVDVAGIRELLADYFTNDSWAVLEHPLGAKTMQTHFIVGGRSGVVDGVDRERLQRCPNTTLDVIPEADHWVHVDAPDALRKVVLGYLS